MSEDGVVISWFMQHVWFLVHLSDITIHIDDRDSILSGIYFFHVIELAHCRKMLNNLEP
jgi:hypothetical protein